MNTPAHSCRFELEPEDHGRLLHFCGQLNSNLHRLEKAFDVYISLRGHLVSISAGSGESLDMTRRAIFDLYQKAASAPVSEEAVELAILEISAAASATTSTGGSVNTGDGGAEADAPDPDDAPPMPSRRPDSIEVGRVTLKLRSATQSDYVRSIRAGGVTVGTGPAGTGKTYLAVACAAEAYRQRRIERIVLVRPAVEAGEKLGFLPGDLQQKVDPYLRPMFDCLHEFFGEEDTSRKLKQNKIEIASLAYMRGRTLSHSFIIMDEAQNATSNQMLMLLTRIGVDSILVVNGDTSQIDLSGQCSGLVEAIDILRDVRDVRLISFDENDIHRSRLVRDIVRAYQLRDERKSTRR